MTKVPDLKLNDNRKMPVIGLGTWLTEESLVIQAVLAAIDEGYRHIDTAFVYKNEQGIGKALKQVFDAGKVKREDLFIVTKLPPFGVRPSEVEKYLNLSLNNLQLDYVDLYLIHSPVGCQHDETGADFARDEQGNMLYDMTTDLEATWKEMEKTVDCGKVRSIGVSNFSANQVERICKAARIKPVQNQVEMHLYFQQKDLLEKCTKLGVTICAYAPLGSPGFNVFLKKVGREPVQLPNILQNPTVLEIASKYKKKSSQVLLRFLIQLGVAVIPKSVNADRIKENFQVFDFELSQEDLKTLIAVDKGQEARIFKAFPGSDKHPEYPY